MTDKLEALSQPVGFISNEGLCALNRGASAVIFPQPGNTGIPTYSQEYVTALREDAARWFNAFEKAVSAGARYEERIEALQQQAVKDGNRIAELEAGHSEAAKQINSWRNLAKKNIAEREKDIAALDVARQRNAELQLSGNSEHVSQGCTLPAGFKLVPVEPTEDMIVAAMMCDDVEFNSDETFCVNFGNIYSAMLAAAPTPTK